MLLVLWGLVISYLDYSGAYCDMGRGDPKQPKLTFDSHKMGPPPSVDGAKGGDAAG